MQNHWKDELANLAEVGQALVSKAGPDVAASDGLVTSCVALGALLQSEEKRLKGICPTGNWEVHNYCLPGYTSHFLKKHLPFPDMCENAEGRDDVHAAVGLRKPEE